MKLFELTESYSSLQVSSETKQLQIEILDKNTNFKEVLTNETAISNSHTKQTSVSLNELSLSNVATDLLSNENLAESTHQTSTSNSPFQEEK